MNDHRQDLERDEELLRHLRRHDRQQPSAALEARILAAAAEAARPYEPQAQGAWQRALGWLAGASRGGRWLAAFGCLAVLGLGLGLSLKTLEQAPPAYDAPPAAMQRQAPAPMALRAPPSPAARSVMAEAAEAAEAPAVVARMVAKMVPPPGDVHSALREIADLRAHGQGEEAEQRVERLKARYPYLDVEAELLRLPEP